MISKNELCGTIVNDLKIIKQLAGKVPESGADFRFTPGQRSTHELLQYLCIMPTGTMQAAQDGNFGWFGENGASAGSITLADVPAKLDEAIADVQQRFDAISDEDFANAQVHVDGMGSHSLHGWLHFTTANFTNAYKMQLFLQAKAAGNTDLDTFDAWMDNGEVERPQPQEA